MEYNIPACADRLASVARLLGEATDGMADQDAAELAVDAVERLKADIDIPLRLSMLGIEESELRPLAEATAQITRLLQANPRPLDADSLEEVLRRAW
jgi:alcohol dehydrogenase class IV